MEMFIKILAGIGVASIGISVFSTVFMIVVKKQKFVKFMRDLGGKHAHATSAWGNKTFGHGAWSKTEEGPVATLGAGIHGYLDEYLLRLLDDNIMREGLKKDEGFQSILKAHNEALEKMK